MPVPALGGKALEESGVSPWAHVHHSVTGTVPIAVGMWRPQPIHAVWPQRGQFAGLHIRKKKTRER